MVYNDTFQKSEQIFEENKIDQDKCGAEAWGYASAGKFYFEPIHHSLWSIDYDALCVPNKGCANLTLSSFKVV